MEIYSVEPAGTGSELIVHGQPDGSLEITAAEFGLDSIGITLTNAQACQLRDALNEFLGDF